MIRNTTRKTVIAQHERYAISARQLAKGLMFSAPHGEFGLVLVLRPIQRIALHMFFVFSRIDVVFANAQYRVVDVKRHFLPFTLYTSRSPACYAIELPAGKSEASRTHIGDQLAFETGDAGAYGV